MILRTRGLVSRWKTSRPMRPFQGSLFPFRRPNPDPLRVDPVRRWEARSLNHRAWAPIAGQPAPSQEPEVTEVAELVPAAELSSEE